MLDTSFLSDECIPWSSTLRHTAPSIYVWHSNEGKEEPQYVNVCKVKQQTVRYTVSVTYCPVSSHPQRNLKNFKCSCSYLVTIIDLAMGSVELN